MIASICQIQVCFWNFLKFFFFFQIFLIRGSIKSSDTESKDMEGNCILLMITYQGQNYDDTKTVKPFRKIN